MEIICHAEHLLLVKQLLALRFFHNLTLSYLLLANILSWLVEFLHQMFLQHDFVQQNFHSICFFSSLLLALKDRGLRVHRKLFSKIVPQNFDASTLSSG